MKAVAIVALLVAAGLGVVLFKTRASTAKTEEAAAAQFQASSNQLAELRTKLALEQGTATQAASNLQHVIDRRTADMIGFSNRLVQANLLVSAARAENAAAQTELQAKSTRIGTLEAKQEELLRRGDAVAPLQTQMARLNERLQSVMRDREFLTAEVRRMELEKNETQAKLADPKFLRIQADKAEEEMELRRRAASARAGARADSRSRVELLPDGSVKLAPPAAPQAKR